MDEKSLKDFGGREFEVWLSIHEIWFPENGDKLVQIPKQTGKN